MLYLKKIFFMLKIFREYEEIDGDVKELMFVIRIYQFFRDFLILEAIYRNIALGWGQGFSRLVQVKVYDDWKKKVFISFFIFQFNILIFVFYVFENYGFVFLVLNCIWFLVQNLFCCIQEIVKKISLNWVIFNILKIE